MASHPPGRGLLSAGLPPTSPRTRLDLIPARVAQLRASFARGTTRPLAWRRAQLAGIEAMMRECDRELLDALRADLGKPEVEARMADVGYVAADARRTRRALARWMRPERVPTPLEQRPARAWLVREPLGVVLVIAPWNYPVQLLLAPLAAAVAAGNCAVLKPSEVTAHTSAVLARLVPRYLDPECIEIVEGGVPETTALLEQRFDHVFYTGNAAVGRIVMQAAARHLTPVTLELGGKSPCIVDATANLEVAARRIVWGKFLNAGQTCVAPDYLLVHESVEGALVEKLIAVLREFYGEKPRESRDLARIVSDRHWQRLAALTREGEVAFGGDVDAADRYVGPTLLRNVPAESPLLAEEIFGPILPLVRFRELDEAIGFVAQREKPLALYLFSESEEAERRVVAETSSGGVCVNATLWHLGNPRLPFGGVGQSGMGAYHGRHGFETFSHRKPVVRRSVRVDPRFAYPPYGWLKQLLIKRFL